MTQKKKETDATYWHPAFYAGIQIELEDDADNLVFENEHQLGKKPMEIDVLIIKKETDRPVKKNIGRIFKKYNIIEYKSPDDSLSVDDFYKVYGYTCFYKADVQYADSIPAEELSITFVSGKYPRKMIKQNNRRDLSDGCRLKIEWGMPAAGHTPFLFLPVSQQSPVDFKKSLFLLEAFRWLLPRSSRTAPA